MAGLPQPASGLDKAWRLGLYVVAVAAPLAVATAEPGSLSLSAYALGQCAPLLAFGVLSLQLILSARWQWVERPFGLDRVYRFHRRMGIVAAGLLLTHPVLLALGGEEMGLLTDLRAPWYIWVGKGTLLLAWLLVLAALCRLTLRIEFEVWRRVHGVVGPALLLGALAHAFGAGTHLQALVPRAVFVGYAVAAAEAVAVARLRSRPAYTVQSVHQETPGVRTVSLTPPPGGQVQPYLPGQFHFLTFRAHSGLPKEEHPFTISSDPTRRDVLTSTIKAGGDFTSRLGALAPGDSALVSAPYGRFSYALHPDEAHCVFIAAEIGITPLMSMIRHLRSTGADRDVLLLYGNRTEEHIVFRQELTEIEAEGAIPLRVVHVLSRPSAEWAGETGRLDAGKFGRLCGDVSGKGFYVCGPPAMMRQTLRALKGLGVPRSRLHYEHFAL